MVNSFYVKEDRFEDVKAFIRSELKSARFNHNPIKIGKEWNISITLEVGDGNKLSKFLQDLYIENKDVKEGTSLFGFFKKIFNLK